MNWTVAHGVYVKLKVFNKIRQFQAKRKFRRVFSRRFRATGQLKTLFWTSFRFLTKDANFKQNETCAVCFDANFGQQESCAQSLGQVLACYQKTPSSSKSTVAQRILSPIASIRTVAHGLLGKFKLLNKSRQIQGKRQLRRVFRRHFRATGQLRTVFLTRFSMLSKDAKLKEIKSCAECFDANLEQRDSFARCFLQDLAS